MTPHFQSARDACLFIFPWALLLLGLVVVDYCWWQAHYGQDRFLNLWLCLVCVGLIVFGWGFWMLVERSLSSPFYSLQNADQLSEELSYAETETGCMVALKYISDV